MKLEIVRPRVEFTESNHNPYWYQQSILKIEECGRVSHKSEGRIKPGSAENFIRKVAIGWGHESILEHASFTVCFVGSRTFSHQLVRHRIGAYTQESQRYCDYAKEGEESALKIVPHKSLRGVYPDRALVDLEYETLVLPNGGMAIPLYTQDLPHFQSIAKSYAAYLHDRGAGVKAEDAREALPNACKTEVYTTYNFRQWRHFFRERLDSHAQWQIKMLAAHVFMYFADHSPIFIEKLVSHSGEPLTIQTVKPLTNPYRENK